MGGLAQWIILFCVLVRRVSRELFVIFLRSIVTRAQHAKMDRHALESKGKEMMLFSAYATQLMNTRNLQERCAKRRTQQLAKEIRKSEMVFARMEEAVATPENYATVLMGSRETTVNLLLV